ncbi:hypothetical protein OKW42_008357 [Paraburkholderia sp. WC7.3d]
MPLDKNARNQRVRIYFAVLFDPGARRIPTISLRRVGVATNLTRPGQHVLNQRGLKRRRDIADLVKEQPTAVRQFEAALTWPLRAGERTVLVAEQPAFPQALHQRRAIVATNDSLLSGPRHPCEQERRFIVHVGHDHPNAAPSRAADGAFAGPELKTLLLVTRKTRSAQAAQLPVRFGQHHKGAPPLHRLHKIVQGLAEGFRHIERRNQRLAHLVDAVQRLPGNACLNVHH